MKRDSRRRLKLSKIDVATVTVTVEGGAIANGNGGSQGCSRLNCSHELSKRQC